MGEPTVSAPVKQGAPGGAQATGKAGAPQTKPANALKLDDQRISDVQKPEKARNTEDDYEDDYEDDEEYGSEYYDEEDESSMNRSKGSRRMSDTSSQNLKKRGPALQG